MQSDPCDQRFLARALAARINFETFRRPRAAEIRGSTPCKAILAINGSLRGLSLPASTLRSFGAPRWLLPCRGHA
jgi:hypothetical protein